MTPEERRNSAILNGSRRARVARGAGVHVSEVNGLLERFAQAQKMMRQMGAGLPGMPGPGRKGRGRNQPSRKAKKGAAATLPSGPSRRLPRRRRRRLPAPGCRQAARWDRGRAHRRPGPRPAGGAGADPELPEELRRMLGATSSACPTARQPSGDVRLRVGTGGVRVFWHNDGA